MNDRIESLKANFATFVDETSNCCRCLFGECGKEFEQLKQVSLLLKEKSEEEALLEGYSSNLQTFLSGERFQSIGERNSRIYDKSFPKEVMGAHKYFASYLEFQLWVVLSKNFLVFLEALTLKEKLLFEEVGEIIFSFLEKRREELSPKDLRSLEKAIANWISSSNQNVSLLRKAFERQV